jgi:single-stranded-DNA-specific exonuclease
MDVLVLDHHLPPGEDVPSDATAVLCPPQISCSYPNTSLAACGVSFKVAQAMLASHVSRDRILRSMLKLAAIGTVADVVDLLTQENRAIVALGLQALNEDRHSPGLASLLRVAGVTQGSITSRELGFRIGPRINAAGRMETATRVVELLTTGDPESAKAQAEQLDELNTQRRSVQEAMLSHAMRQVPDPPPPFIVVAEIDGPNWHRGVSGIVAARLRDTHNRPAAVIAINPGGATGSARSIPEVHAVRCLEAASDLLDRFGGHPAAAGFSLQPEKVAALRERLAAAATEQLNGKSPALIHRADAAVPVQEADFSLLRALDGLAPHGKGNPEPLLLLKGGTVRNTRLIKEKHLKGSLWAGGQKVDFIWWGGGQHRAAVEGQQVEVLAKLGVNVWQGIERLQLTVEDARVL